jgi:hypothetical protein
MRRILVGSVLILHGLAHTLAGMRAAESSLRWSMTAAWALALVGFAAAGLSLMGVHGLGTSWRRFAAAGLIGSVVLLVGGWPTPPGAAGLAIDAFVLCLLFATRPADPVIGGITPAGPEPRARDLMMITALFGLVLLVGLRPWHMRWGSTDAELHAALPGDDPAVRAKYQIQHAVTVYATPDRIWPWLVQLGADRGGFYSYAALERLVGLRVRNADRIHPEWQGLRAGDTVYASHPGWLGFQRRFGWRAGLVRPDTVLVLERWGAFVLVPAGPQSTRLIVRTRGAGGDNLAAVVLAPLGFALFEPIHFVMERKMLLTLKERAEGGERVVLYPADGRDGRVRIAAP